MTTGQNLAAALRARLAPEHWPIRVETLPSDAVLVGGAVRDAVLGRLQERPDLDLVVSEGAISLGRRLAREQSGTCVVLDDRRDIARVVLAGWSIDLARRQGSDLAADLQRRDYTVNAMALPLAPGSPVVDPTGGLRHLRHRQLVTVAEANLLEDPLRLLRGLRLAAELEFSIESGTLQAIRRHAPRLGEVAGERVLTELEKLSAAQNGDSALALVCDLKLLEPWSVEPSLALPKQRLALKAARMHGLLDPELSTALPIARMAWLLAGPAAGRLKGSRRLQQRCELLRRWWEVLAGRSLGSLGENERLELHRQMEEDLPALVLNLAESDARRALVRWRDPNDVLFHPKPPLDGHRLQQILRLQPGPVLGQVLNHLMAERAFGRLPPDDIPAAIQAAEVWLRRRIPTA
ncbi:MAG: CCA tRNA nucleotidyltransferase [Cyanobacteriota bacterium]|nr:CCA tRNA nucleotidyltransferase [Cyanobacteriota bacterium]